MPPSTDAGKAIISHLASQTRLMQGMVATGLKGGLTHEQAAFRTGQASACVGADPPRPEETRR